MPERVFFGRRAELSRLDALLAAAADRRPQLVCLEGPAGIGKSTLLDQLRRSHAADAAVTVVAVAAERVESQRPYALFSDVLAALDVGAPYRALPASADAFTVGLRLLAQLNGTVMLLVDDVQWADPSSLKALLFALRRVRTEPLLTVLAWRSGEPLADDLARVLAQPATEQLELKGFDVEATAQLCGHLLGSPVEPARAARLRLATDGNPLWLTAAARDPARLGPTTAAEPLPPPPEYADLIARQLAGCTADVRALTLAVAVTGPATVRELVAVVAAAGGDVTGPGWPDLVVAEAAAARLVTTHADEVRPHHALTSAAAYWSLSSRERAALHRSAAGALLDIDRRLEQRCAADALAGADSTLPADLSERAAELRAVGSSLRAAAMTLAGADRAATHTETARLRTYAALDLVRGGDLGGAGLIAAAAEQAAETAAGLALRGSLALLQGRPTEAATLLTEGFERAGPDRYVAGICAAQMTALVINVGRGQETLKWAKRSAALTPGDGTSQLLLAAAEGVLLDGPAEPLPQSAPATALAGIIAGRGVQQLWCGQEQRAALALQEAVTVALRRGPMLVGVIAGYYLAEARFRLGDHLGALEVSDANLSLAHDSDMVFTWTLAHATRVGPLTALGRLTEAREHLEIARLHSIDDFASVLWLAVAGARIAMTTGDCAAALAAVSTVDATADAAGADNPTVQPWRILKAAALIGVGRQDEAATLLGDLESSLRRWERPWASVQVARARAAWHSSAGDLERAESVLTVACASYPEHPSWEAALLQADLGGVLRRRGTRAPARSHLQSAHARLTTMGALPDAKHIGAELMALDRPAGAGLLTGRERDVVDLVIGGSTNREVASALHLSVKTVEYHLGHVFTKLNVHSRGGLNRALVQLDAV